MYKKILNTTVFTSLSLVAITSAFAADSTLECRLKGGSVVPLPAAACALEGGVPVMVIAVPAAQSTSTIARVPTPPPTQFSTDPKLATAQRAVLEILNKSVVEKAVQKSDPENISRVARFDGCTLQVDELVHVDHGNIFSKRKHFKIHAQVNLQKLGAKAMSDLGSVDSLGGGLKTYAVALVENKHGAENNITVSIAEQMISGEQKYTQPGPIAYWGTVREDLWMADEYGYPQDSGFSQISTDKIRLLLMVETADDAHLLKQSLEDARAACQP